MVRHAQITQKNKCAISLEYLKKELNDEGDFMHTDKHESLLEIDSMIFMGMIKFPKSSFQHFWTSNFPTRLILSLLMGMIKHSQITQSNKFAISLQYLKK